jgi:hypothetical protein
VLDNGATYRFHLRNNAFSDHRLVQTDPQF